MLTGPSFAAGIERGKPTALTLVTRNGDGTVLADAAVDARASALSRQPSSGARRETLFGLSGFGDLVLTCTSTQSHNLHHGLAIGSGAATDRVVAVQGVMTAHAVAEANPQTEAEAAVNLPVTRMVQREVWLDQSARLLLSRPLHNEDWSRLLFPPYQG